MGAPCSPVPVAALAILAACRPAPPGTAEDRPGGALPAPDRGRGAEPGVAPARAGSGAAEVAPPSAERRTPVLADGDPRFERYEGPADDPCASDRDCRIGGCSGEICAREPGLSTCEVLPARLPDDAHCGCVAGRCRWYSPSGATLPPAPRPPRPVSDQGIVPGAQPGERCGNAVCRPPERCVRYFGIAGPGGPRLESCEIPCDGGGPCPRGMTCVVIDDGPGEVCRPAEPAAVPTR